MLKVKVWDGGCSEKVLKKKPLEKTWEFNCVIGKCDGRINKLWEKSVSVTVRKVLYALSESTINQVAHKYTVRKARASY